MNPKSYISSQGRQTSIWNHCSEEAFAYHVTYLSLSIATPEGGLFQADKAGFRNFFINEAEASSEDFVKNAEWVFDGMSAVRCVKPKETYEEWFAELLKYFTPPSDACVR